MASKRKLIGFDPETWQALDLLSRDSRKSVQQLADEAFADLLTKHHRPRTLKDALKQSSRNVPANENKPQKKRRS
jgi:antitoxin-like ribbon-helix-helix protein